MFRGYCPICKDSKDQHAQWNWQPKLALYIRRPGKGFVRVGTLYTQCRHAVYTFPENILPS